MRNYKKEIEEFVLTVVNEGASDLHISAGRIPMIRVNGNLIALTDYAVLSADDAMGFAKLMISEKRYEEFLDIKESDFAYRYSDKIRFRGNAFFQKGVIGIALRAISNEVLTLEDLNLPKILETFARRKQGFFLVVGPVGEGKSTTLASMINMINSERKERIVTIEDPVEYIFTEDKSVIEQREIRVDTDNFHSALRSMLRQDIDVGLIGEMRGPQTMAAAVTAAETGHLIFSTLHTNDAAQTVDRIIDTFPPVQQQQIRTQLASSLLGIFSQRLVPRITGGRIPAYELLINNNAVSSLIREGRSHEIGIIIETSSEKGMITMNQSLAKLVREGEITPDNAYQYSTDPKALERLL